jgi:PLD-like domain
MNTRVLSSLAWTLVVCSVAGGVLYTTLRTELHKQGIGPQIMLESHYAPTENLEAIDVATLRRACCSVEIAAYSLTDLPIINTLTEDARSGVIVQVYLDREQTVEAMRRPTVSAALNQLAATKNATVRIKHSATRQNLNTYCVDTARLRTGNADFSYSGEIEQDSLLITDDPTAVRSFEMAFEALNRRTDNYRLQPLQR